MDADMPTPPPGSLQKGVAIHLEARDYSGLANPDPLTAYSYPQVGGTGTTSPADGDGTRNSRAQGPTIPHDVNNSWMGFYPAPNSASPFTHHGNAVGTGQMADPLWGSEPEYYDPVWPQ